MTGQVRTPDTLRTLRLHGLEPTPEATRALHVRGVPSAPLRLLVRADEFPCAAGYDDERFGAAMSERFHDVMAGAGVRYLIAVVPQWTHDYLDPHADGGRPLDERDRRLLDRMRADGVSFGQRGLTHRTRDAVPRRHSELDGLDAGALANLLDRGRHRMDEWGCRPRVLVPPFNRFEAGQWTTLAERYDLITGGPESVPKLGFHGGPQWRGDAVYLPSYAPLYARASSVLGAVEAAIEARVTTWVPVVLHSAWEIEDDFAALGRLARRMAPYAESREALPQAADDSREAT